MNKKSLFAILAAPALLGLASCSQDDPATPAADGTVTFSVSLDNRSTRAVGDGQSASELQYYVYSVNGSEYTRVLDGTAAISNNKASVDLKLANSVEYAILFWAQAPVADDTKAVYTISDNTASGPQLTVNYANMAANSETNDAFYCMVPSFVGGSKSSEDVTLTRPLSLVSVGTDDLDATAITKAFPDGVFAGVSLNAYAAMDFMTGRVTGDQVAVSGKVGKVDDALKAQLFPVGAAYKYLATQYVLVDDEGSMSDVTLALYKDAAGASAVHSLKVTNAPLKRNFRTNIYGSLMTSTSNWQVKLDPNWSGALTVPVTNGVVSQDVLEQGGTLVLNDAATELTIPTDLKADLKILLNNKVENLTIGATSKPVTIEIGRNVAYPDFKFVKDSNVENLTVIADPNSTESLASGFDFFHSEVARPASMKNVTFDGVVFDGEGFVNQYVVTLENAVFNNCKFLNQKDNAIGTQQSNGGGNQYNRNLTLTNCEIVYADDANKTANGLYLLDMQGKVTITGCTIKNAKYHGIFISGLAGGDQLDIVLKDNKIEGALKDGIKIQEVKGTISITDNNIQGHENGIRLKNAIGTQPVTITGNTIDMSEVTAAWDENSGEPSAILLINDSENAGALVTVKDNTINSSNGHDFTAKNIKYSEGSVYPQ